MADADVQQALQALAQLGAAAGGSRAAVASVGQSMARLRIEMQRGTGTIQSNAAALQRLASDFEDLDEGVRKSTAGQAMLAEQTRMAGQIMRDASGQLSAGLLKGGIVEAIDYVAKQIYSTISSYQEGASGIQTAFNMQNAAMESQIRILDRLSQGATLAAETLALIPSPVAKAAAALSGLVAGAAGVGKQFSEEQSQAFKIFQKELAVTVGSFDILNKSGALIAGGFGSMSDTAGKLQLTLPEFAKTVNENKKDLAEFGNTVVGGVKKIKNVGIAFTQLASQGKDLRKELEYAGYSSQEQVDGLVQYMDMLNKSGQLRSKSDTEIAIGATEYLKNLKAISAFTGEDVKTAQKRAQQASEQLAVQAKLAEQGPGAFERFTTAVAEMGPEITKGLQQMTAFDGTIVDKNLNQLLAASPTRKKLLDETYADMQNKALGAAEVNANYQRRVKEYGEALKQEALAAGKTYGAINLASGQQGEVTSMLQQQAELGRKGEAAREKEIAALGDTTVQMSRLITETSGVNAGFRDVVIEAERFKREMNAKMITDMSGLTESYLKTLNPKKMMAEQEKEMSELMHKVLKQFSTTDIFTKPGSRVAGAMASTVDKIFEGMGVVVGKLGTAADRLGKFADDVGKYFSNNTSGDKKRDLGTLGMTGSLFEKEDFFGKVAKGETVLTPQQLENLVKGVSVSSIQGTAGRGTEGITGVFEKLSKTVAQSELKVTPAPQTDTFQNVGNQLKDSFTQSMAAFQQQKLQAETAKPAADDTESTKIVEAIQEAFSGQNGFNQMLSSLKGQLETDNDKQIAVLQEQVSKLEDLLSAMQDNVDYTKRIADNIA